MAEKRVALPVLTELLTVRPGNDESPALVKCSSKLSFCV